MRIHWVIRPLIAAALVVATGCIPELPPPVTTVQLVNATSGDVTPNLYVSATADSAEALFSTSANLRTDFTDRPFPELRPNETKSIEVSCDQLRTLGVSRPILFDAGSVAVTSSDDVIFLISDGDFECGKIVRFTYLREGDAFRVRYDVDP